MLPMSPSTGHEEHRPKMPRLPPTIRSGQWTRIVLRCSGALTKLGLLRNHSSAHESRNHPIRHLAILANLVNLAIRRRPRYPPEWVAHLRKLIRQEMQTVLMPKPIPASGLPTSYPTQAEKQGFEGERKPYPDAEWIRVLADLFQKERARGGI